MIAAVRYHPCVHIQERGYSHPRPATNAIEATHTLRVGLTGDYASAAPRTGWHVSRS